jgi:hypothetical protein
VPRESSPVHQPKGGRNAARRELSIAFLSVIIHALVVAASLVPGWRADPLVNGDAVSYLVPAQSILATGHFSRETGPEPRWDPTRTPGYPLVLAVSLALTGGMAAALFLSCMTAGLAAWSAARLVVEWGGGAAEAWMAGAMVAILPNSLGLSARLLTDAMFAHLFLFWLFLTWRGLRTGHLLALAGSGTICVALQMLKPTFNLAPLLIVLVAATAGCLWTRGRTVALLLLISLATPLYFASRMLRDHGVFSPSLLGTEAVREYLQVRALAAEESVGEEEMQRRVRAADWAAVGRLTSPESEYGRLHLVKKAAVRAFVFAHPMRTLWLMAMEAIKQFLAPQEFAFEIFLGELPVPGRAAGSVLTLAIWALAAAGAWTLWKRGLPGAPLLVAGIFVVFLGAGSISHWVGGRLRLPADVAAAPLFGAGAARLLLARRLV